ncbi:acetyltransferase EpsM [Hoeflea halophila]|uniref:Acetyltransferase EpsM n=1 Tax=Hoeflea halophila TaxID=714899 RepID=A0A286IET9_9HYPH|nr:NeuD/PglB/VioB family sugar acetyltransferase [Hoeflea halophila]SOE17814.1 acetyltransferase EpsM [Hoeflea halophila]
MAGTRKSAEPSSPASEGSQRGLLIVGGGGHGRVVAEAAFLSGRFSRLLVVDPHAATGWTFTLCPCVAKETDVDARPAEWRFIAAVGDPALRRRLFNQFLQKGFAPANVLHPAAVISPSALIGRGVAVCAGAVVATLARVGEGVIVNHNAVVEHDSETADFAHLAPGSVLAGGARLGEGSFLGSNASIRHGKSVGSGIVIGNGAAVATDISKPGIYGGTPARLLKMTTLPREG